MGNNETLFFVIGGHSIQPGLEPCWVYLAYNKEKDDAQWSVNPYRKDVTKFDTYEDALAFSSAHPEWCMGAFIFRVEKECGV